MVFRPVQLLNLLFLLLGDGVFLFIHPVQEHEDYAGEQPNHNHGKGGIKKGVAMDVGRDNVREIEGDPIAKKGLRRT